MDLGAEDSLGSKDCSWKEIASEELCLEVKGGGSDAGDKTWLFCCTVCSVVSKA